VGGNVVSPHEGVSPATDTMGAVETEAIRTLLEGAFPDAAELAVEDRTGTGDHFQVTVVSAAFDGLPLLDQHRRVNDALAAPLGDGSIHELRIKTKGIA
jgi:stress-induced morphogen